MPGRHGGRLKARFLRRLSVMSGSVNNVAACNPPPPLPINSERNDVTFKTETENRFYKMNPVLETLVLWTVMR